MATHFEKFVRSALNLGPIQVIFKQFFKVRYEGISAFVSIETLNEL